MYWNKIKSITESNNQQKDPMKCNNWGFFPYQKLHRDTLKGLSLFPNSSQWPLVCQSTFDSLNSEGKCVITTVFYYWRQLISWALNILTRIKLRNKTVSPCLSGRWIVWESWQVLSSSLWIKITWRPCVETRALASTARSPSRRHS